MLKAQPLDLQLPDLKGLAKIGIEPPASQTQSQTTSQTFLVLRNAIDISGLLPFDPLLTV